jgi:hypothetical protein
MRLSSDLNSPSDERYRSATRGSTRGGSSSRPALLHGSIMTQPPSSPIQQHGAAEKKRVPTGRGPKCCGEIPFLSWCAPRNTTLGPAHPQKVPSGPRAMLPSVIGSIGEPKRLGAVVWLKATGVGDRSTSHRGRVPFRLRTRQIGVSAYYFTVISHRRSRCLRATILALSSCR